MSPSLLSALCYLALTLAADLAALTLARPLRPTLLGMAGVLGLARAVVLWIASRGPVQALMAPLEQADADLAAAARATARLPALSMRVTLLSVLVSYGLVVAVLPELAFSYCAAAVALQLLAAVMHRFVVGGPLLEGPRRLLAARLPVTAAAVETPLGFKLLWLALATTSGGVALIWVAARQGSAGASTAAAVLALLLAALAALLAARDIARNAAELASSTERLAAGDLSEAVPMVGDDEHGRIAAGLRQLAEALRRTSGAAEESMSNVGRHVAAVAGGAADAAAAVRAGSGSLASILAAATDLERLAREGAGDADKLAAAVRALTDVVGKALGMSGDPMLLGDAETLRRAGEAAGTASTELLTGIHRLAQSVQGLSQSSLDTASSTSAMDDAIARVRAAAADTADLSSRVSGEAERGYRAVHKTLDEIERIRDLVEEARRTIDELGRRVDGIGAVVVVIEEIAQKTNLLALNASIIAAQAGQHGRGFAVVASEIKALAQRTAASTKEIGEQITGIQQESARAMSAMANGVDAVNQGFQVAVGAGDALGEIRQSARSAQKKVQGIARAMDEQAGASRRVAEATGQQASLSQQIAQAIREHAHGGQRIRGAADEMAEVARRVDERLRKSSAGAAGVDDALAALTTIAREHARQQKDRLRGAERLEAAVTAVREAEALTAERVKLLGQVAALLRDETAQLQRKLDQLRPA